ncbi:DUF523 and DUF1722 domain-containing protein [Thalassomonas sp. RHCl1]|uniref:YbgA family protein n=1 Tax=Thalassomonas sp. RHCl1 TaxID=2995320 RepID=UPI00248A9014|nr:DUF523 and DUF1722 domain-containing protein [Thalassomonas sp. RHCl1]
MKKQQIIATMKVQQQTSAAPQIQIGLSACLAGHAVRYNGGHTQSRLCLDVLSKHFTFKTFCPEVAAGFGTPRPTMRLTGDPSAPKLVFSKGDGGDLSEQLIKGFTPELAEMAALDGYILMKNSPSCGLQRVKVYQENGHPHQVKSAGLFAKALKKAYPSMPIEEEGRLNDNKIFDNFVQRIYAYHNFRTEVMAQPGLHKLTQFHSSYKYLLMAHDQRKCRELGQLLASGKKMPLQQLTGRYLAQFMQALEQPASKKNHANALLHILGYIKKSLPSPAKQDILAVIDRYKSGITPLATPLALLSHYLNQHGSVYIKAQRYLNPYPQSMHPIRHFCR